MRGSLRVAAPLFALDLVTNVVDYGFHLYLGRALLAADFAAVQTVNALLLIIVTSAGVTQPVVARYGARGATGATLFRRYLGQGTALGLLLVALLVALRQPLATTLNIPVGTILPAALMIAFSLLRPVVAGMLQGQQHFIAFGMTRLLFALGRLGLALFLVSGLGLGAVGGVGAYPLGAALALAAGLWWVDRSAWRPGPPAARETLQAGRRLSLAALLAYGAYMSLLNLDLIGLNRVAPATVSGSYATAVVFRRILAVLPGAVLVILFPRVVARVEAGGLPDRLLLRSAGLITLSNVVGTLLYTFLGASLVRLLFGARYPAAAPLLGWMGVGMVGFGIAGVWLNLFLATRPWPFVALLVATALAQAALLVAARGNVTLSTALFGLGGWLPALGGLPLYLGWLRPRLRAVGRLS